MRLAGLTGPVLKVGSTIPAAAHPHKSPRCLRKNVLETDSMPQKKRYSNRPTPDRPAKGHEDAAFDARE
ncbi:MAG: hypothetical protein WC971_01350, partial [Coriobacteriia bacterium]